MGTRDFHDSVRKGICYSRSTLVSRQDLMCSKGLQRLRGKTRFRRAGDSRVAKRGMAVGTHLRLACLCGLWTSHSTQLLRSLPKPPQTQLFT